MKPCPTSLRRTPPAGAALVLVALLGAANAHSQGMVQFANMVGSVLRARAFELVGDDWVPLDGRYVVQLHAASADGDLAAVGAPIPFRTLPAEGRGFWRPEIRAIPDVPEGSLAQLKVVAWASADGESYAAARVRKGRVAESDVLWVNAGGWTRPPTFLLGLDSLGITDRPPVSVRSAARILSALVLPNGHPVLNLRGLPGRTYTVQRGATNSLGRDWFKAGEILLEANGLGTFEDTSVVVADADTRFVGTVVNLADPDRTGAGRLVTFRAVIPE